MKAREPAPPAVAGSSKESAMERAIRESDWKLFRQLQPVALDRFCRQVLDDVGRLGSDAGKSNHERYLAVFRLLRRRDEELGDAFNDTRRSNAVLQLARIRLRGLLSEDEFARFSPETRSAVEALLEFWGSEVSAETDEADD
jgi:hypothetical protein